MNTRLIQGRVFSPEETAMAEREYDVARIHEGDKLYIEGDVRTLSEADAKHLVDLGVLVPRAEKPKLAEPKAEPAPMNKSEPAALGTKTTHQRHKRK